MNLFTKPHRSLKRLALLGAAVAALGATSGCISTSETVYSDAPRAKVAFATEKAGRIFYETLANTPEGRQRTEKRTSVNLILIDVDQKTVSGPNRLFNEAVMVCDSDRDGTITESEAEIFSHAWPTKR